MIKLQLHRQLAAAAIAPANSKSLIQLDVTLPAK
jgi:hypothetical protein